VTSWDVAVSDDAGETGTTPVAFRGIEAFGGAPTGFCLGFRAAADGEVRPEQVAVAGGRGSAVPVGAPMRRAMASLPVCSASGT
jgi:hypothetical protein